MKPMRNFLLALFFLSALAITLLYHEEIATYIIENYIYRKTIIIEESNAYKREYDFNYVQRTDNFYPKNKQDVYNTFYTILNNGWTNFSFFCDKSYETCLSDVNQIINDNTILSNINNFVHPYNTFNTLNITTNSFGKVTVSVDYMYSADEIIAIEEKVDAFLEKNIDDKMDTKKKIRIIHDYIAENTIYDKELAENLDQDLNAYKYKSHIAYGPLIQGYGLCGGYSDAMAIFLNKLGIKNYKVSNIHHVWNYVLVDDKWYHLDLTWDDPVLSNGEQVVLHNFFLITDSELKEINTNEHTYDKDIFK